MSSQSHLDPTLNSLLQTLRSRIRRYIVWDSLLAVFALVLSAFWIGLALDYLPVQLGGTEMPRLARTLLLGVVAASLFVVLLKMLAGRLHRPLPDDSLALLVERHHPSLGGRLVTAVQLNETGRTGDSHSRTLLDHVHAEAASEIDKVDPNRIFRLQPLLHKLAIAGPLGIAALVFLILSPQAFALAASRLTLLSDDPWPRRADIQMVGIELPVVTASDDTALAPELLKFNDKKMQLPRGSNATLRIRARAEDAELPVACTVYYQTDSGTRGQSSMRRVGRIVDGFQSFVLDGAPLTALSESVTLDIRGLDDRLDDYRIEAITPPALVNMSLQIRYPEYLSTADDGQMDMVAGYQSGLRLREGSDVTLVASSSVPLGEVDVFLKTDKKTDKDLTLNYSEDQKEVRFTLTDFNEASTISIVPKDTNGISAQAPFRYFLGVVLDEPPELNVEIKGIGTSITAKAKLPVTAQARDDYGVTDLVLAVTPAATTATSTDSAEQPATQSAATSPALDRNGEAATELDLKELVDSGTLSELAPGTAVNLIGEAMDGYNLGAEHVTRSEVYRLEVVTPEQLLALLERRELGLRSRLEQTINEMTSLRQTLDLLRRTGFEVPENASDEATTRSEQVRRLRTQQSGLQANKTSEELLGIALSLDDILLEMRNNRVDSVDRSQRIATGVRDPINVTVNGSLAKLRTQIKAIETMISDPEQGIARTAEAVSTAEDVILQLNAILEKMLDLETYNEVLDLVRQLMDDQADLTDDTKKERKKQVLDLFK
ncbi:MAG: polyketide synthase [Planctomycetaceae bacterium TMED240]|nr:polyketide synthase [Rhodopirellula sp.]OUX06885.1 MAG: polyketide synthase [Planctomycetaceae bacterium TMED240]